MFHRWFWWQFDATFVRWEDLGHMNLSTRLVANYQWPERLYNTTQTLFENRF